MKDSRKLCYDGCSDRKSKDSKESFDCWQKILTFLYQWIQWYFKNMDEFEDQYFPWKLWILSKTWKVVETGF